MPSCTLRRNSSLAGSVDNPKMTARGQIAGPSTMPSKEAIYDMHAPGRDNSKRFILKRMTALLQSARKEYD